MAKLKVGWFSFSCCEDNTIVFTELLNDNWEKWKDLVEFKHARVLQSNNVLEDIDVAFVEGAIANKKNREELEKIRKNSKKVVAIGSCACTGIPSNHRNKFDEETKASIQYLIDRYGYEKEVLSIDQVVEVEDKVPGCPMVEANFLKVLTKYLEEFKIIPPPK
jgi:coenzyme F420-reducing hydrogenase gamma subunit